MTDQEKAIADARKEAAEAARAELTGAVNGRLFTAELRAASAGKLLDSAITDLLVDPGVALKLLGLGTAATGIALLAAVLVAPTAWMVVRRANGFPALARSQRRAKARAAFELGNERQTAPR